MNYNKAFQARQEDVTERWKVIDATNKRVGRLASTIVHMAKGKDEPTYTPHVKSGFRIIIINAEKVVFSGKKMDMKVYRKHTRFIGNDQEILAKDLLREDPTEILRKAIGRMMQKHRSPLARDILENNVLIYAGSNHPHIAQIKK